jgi:nucleotide-binding universal stress UspA family protein
LAERILIPLDGSKMGESALRYVKKIVAETKPQVTPEIVLLQVVKPPVHHMPVEGGVVNIANDEDEIKQQKEAALGYLNKEADELKGMGVTVSCEVVVANEATSSAESIIKAEKDLNIDLVAMSTHGRRGVSRWAFGSVTEKVLRGGSVPVMMVRAKE